MLAILDPCCDVESSKWDFTPKLIEAVVEEGDEYR